MTDVERVILHNYPTSPFAEKITLIMGFKGMHWTSALIPLVMPKPDVVALTGGYRKTPILQVGADIYCDSALIADVIETLSPQPSLYPAGIAGPSRRECGVRRPERRSVFILSGSRT
jgi:glutathione S-transferase